MSTDVREDIRPLEAQLSGIAARLMDIAEQVALEAEAATAVVRSMVDQTTRVAFLAETLEAAAGLMEVDIRCQSDSLASARATLDTASPVVEGLGQSIANVQTISAVIAGIAKESRILSLNARIEAARTGTDGAAFGVVASEMAKLTARMLSANESVSCGASTIARDVSAASRIVTAHGELVVEHDGLLTASLEGAGRQRDAAAELATITTETVSTVDAAAAAIGRVGANAAAVRVLARQLTRLTR